MARYGGASRFHLLNLVGWFVMFCGLVGAGVLIVLLLVVLFT